MPPHSYITAGEKIEVVNYVLLLIAGPMVHTITCNIFDIIIIDRRGSGNSYIEFFLMIIFISVCVIKNENWSVTRFNLEKIN